MEPFIVNCDITNVNELFCRKKEINTLISYARRKENVGIIGARRFGKTCLLKSMESYVGEHSEINAIPVYFDVKSQTTIHKNTPEVYYTLASLLAKRMCEMGILCEGDFKLSRRCTLDVSTDFIDMKIQMSTWNPEYQQQALFSLADEASKKNKYVLLLLDEIDALLLDALNTASDFGRIRGAALDKSNKLKIWIAGTAPWKAITTNIGSPELNCGIKPIILSSSDASDFNKMWESECSLIENGELKKKLISIADSIFEKTGGIPYYAKYIGSCFINGTIEIMPDYTILRDYISEIYNNRFMTESERSILNILSNGAKSFESIPDDVNALISKGLVSKFNDSCSIVFNYMSDYVKAIASNAILQVSSNIEKTERESIVDEIKRLWDSVIRSFQDAPFKPTSEDSINFDILKEECSNNSGLIAFSTSLCKLYYEGSEKGKRLPSDFYKHDFCNMIRALRNKSDHILDEYEPKQMSDKKLSLLINNGVWPFEKDHFICAQMNILKMFRAELIDMLSICKKNTSRKEDSNIQQEISKILEDGKDYEGDIVSVSNQHGTFLNVKCLQHTHSLHIIGKIENLNEGDRVMFKAVKEQNIKDPNKVFWKAGDVRLKEE